MPKQRTIAETIACKGIGLHSGGPVALELHPAAPGTGVVFVCRDGATCVEIPARSALVTSTANATTLSKDGASISTVEHLLAALSALGVDNVRAEVQGAEIPVMDGSAAPFVERIRAVGTRVQSAPRRCLVVQEPLSVSDGARRIRIEPAPALRISYAIDFAHPAIGRQQLEIPDCTPRVFEKELAGARTFGFLKDFEALRAAGLAGGASLDNTLVLDEKGLVNPDGLRWPDELVRHKVLDLLGDLALIGHPIRGHVLVERGGHSLHRALVAELESHPRHWRLQETAVSRGGRARVRADRSPTGP